MDAKELETQKRMRAIGRSQFGYILTDFRAWPHVGTELLLCATELRGVQRAKQLEVDAFLASGRREFSPEESPIFRLASCEGTISLLLGFALENFLKGAWVKLNPASDISESELPPSFRDRKTAHNLVAHAEAVGIALDSDEEHVLKILTEYTVWRGRYPIAVNANLNGESWAKSGPLHVICTKPPEEEGWTPAVNSIFAKLAGILWPEKYPQS